MRFVHTADWHLGKRLLGHPLIDDQAYALDQIERLCVEEKADALVIAGDVFDRSVPPVEAVTLLDDFFERMVRRARIPVVAIAGNHDSPERLGFGRSLLEGAGVHMRTTFGDRMVPIEVPGVGGVLEFVTLPYLEPEVVRAATGDAEVTTHDAALRRALADVPPRADPDRFRVLVAHAFCVGGIESPDSERPLMVGGAGYVHPSAFKGFDYVALGHLHRPQRVAGRDHIRYAGSLLKYAIEEHNHPKGVAVVEIVAGPKAPLVTTREVTLAPKRDLVRLEGTFDELSSGERFTEHEGDYVAVTYTDATYVLQAAERLRGRFPYLLEAMPKRVRRVQDDETPGEDRPDQPRELLEAFWSYLGIDHDLEEAHRVAFERAWLMAKKEDA
ncbi:MAG: exonuclease SbcCD subunit D [Myxococcales bacterium]|nr:exonuclease SbcCD subunit D [Myxococcales bacterium]